MYPKGWSHRQHNNIFKYERRVSIKIGALPCAFVQAPFYLTILTMFPLYFVFVWSELG